MNDLALNLAIEIISGMVLLVIIVSQWLDTDRHTKANRYFLAVLCTLFASMAFDAVSWMVDEKPGGFYLALAHVANFGAYFTSIFIKYFYMHYIGVSIPLTGHSKRFAYRVAEVITILFMVIVVVNQFNGIVYYIDGNNLFHWGPMYWIPHTMAVIWNILILWAVLQNEKGLGIYATLSYASYAVIPLLADVVNIYFYQVIIVYPAMIIALLIIFVNIQMQRDRKRKEQELTLQNQQMALKLSQIQPHFVFNTLTAIKTLYKTNPAQAEKTLDDFAAHLRTMINTPDMPDLIYFRDEMRNVYTYLSIEQQRFKNHFEVVYDIGERFFFIPPLTLQPIVENAVLHGLTIGKGGSKLIIKTDETQAAYIVTVIDDGNGFDQSAPLGEGKTHVGIENVRSRLETLCNGQLIIESQIGKGTKVTMIIPKGDKDE